MLLRCPRVLGVSEGIKESDIYVFGVLRMYMHARMTGDLVRVNTLREIEGTDPA